MKVVILAGGYGTRISEVSNNIPKPMIEIGQKPILWHIMKNYSFFGHKHFIICLGHKGYLIKEYFINYYNHNSDLTIDLSNNSISTIDKNSEDWKISLINTGQETLTGGRIKRICQYIDEDLFLMTYGDGVGDININRLIDFHLNHGKLATITVSRPQGRFGELDIDYKSKQVKSFVEKPKNLKSLVNSGYFVLSKKIYDYIADDMTMFEAEPLENLAKDGELVAFEHDSFWHPIDTPKDLNYVNSLWSNNLAPWKIWK